MLPVGILENQRKNESKSESKTIRDHTSLPIAGGTEKVKVNIKMKVKVTPKANI